MTSPIGGLLAGLGQGAVQGLQYRDRQRMIEQMRQDRLAREEEERRRWEVDRAYRQSRDKTLDERAEQARLLEVEKYRGKLMQEGWSRASEVENPTAREEANPSALDGLIQDLAGQRVADGITIDGQRFAPPGENDVQRRLREDAEKRIDADRRQEAGFAQQLAMLAKQQAFQAEQNRLNRAADRERGQGSGSGFGPFATAAAREKFEEQDVATKDLLGAIEQFRTLLDDTGVELLPTERRARLSSAYAQLKLKYKEAARLGALTGPDVVILEQVIKDPTSLLGAIGDLNIFGQRAGAIGGQLDELLKQTQRDANTRYAQRGLPEPYQGAPLTTADRIRQELMRGRPASESTGTRRP